MKMEAWMLFKPLLDLIFFVGGVIINDAVNIKILGNMAVDGFQKSEKLLMAMPFHALSDNFTLEYIKRGK